MSTGDNIYPHRFQAAPLLAQKFIRDYEDVVKEFSLELRVDVTEHLVNVIELIRDYVETTDQSIWNRFKDQEEALLKKYGKLLTPYSEKRFYQYFYFDTALLEKEVYPPNQFDRLSPDEQRLTSDEQQIFLRLSRNALLNARNFLWLQKEPGIDTEIAAIPDMPEIDRDFTKARQLLAIYCLLKASFDIEHRSSHPVSAFARFAHLLTGTKITNLQNSDIYKKYSQMPDYKSGERLIDDLKFIRPYFEELNIVKALELIDEQIQELSKKSPKRQ